MPLELPDDYWLEIPACSYTLGFTPEEAHRWAQMAADFMNAQPLPEMDAWEELDLRERRTGNAEVLERDIRAVAPARQVEIPAYTIARFRVTRGMFLQFVRETGYCPLGLDDRELGRWRDRPNEPVHGRSWADVEAFTAWCGYRVPFEDEWERAARGPDRSLFPWGAACDPENGRLMAGLYDDGEWNAAVAQTFSTPEGFVAYPDSAGDWCADLWHTLVPSSEHLSAWVRWSNRWARTVKGHIRGLECIEIVDRFAGRPESERNLGYGFRLVKQNGRTIPVAPPMTGWSGARAKVRAFERDVVRPALEGAFRLLEAHRPYVWQDWEKSPEAFGGTVGELLDNLATSDPPGISKVSAAYFDDPSRPAFGMFLGAITQESMRRVANGKHGVFLFNLHYRLDAVENVVARPTSFFRMHYDGQWHRFDDRFRPDEDDTPIAETTSAMVAQALLAAFTFYDDYADADAPPVIPGRRETKTAVLPVFHAR